MDRFSCADQRPRSRLDIEPVVEEVLATIIDMAVEIIEKNRLVRETSQPLEQDDEQPPPTVVVTTASTSVPTIVVNEVTVKTAHRLAADYKSRIACKVSTDCFLVVC